MKGRNRAYHQYCSTNYILLGLVLANHYHRDGDAWSWQAYDQKTVVPSALRKAGLLDASTFADSGACDAYTDVHGFMESYDVHGATFPPQDISNVSCVGGWTGGNYLGPVSDVAQYTYDLYSPAAGGSSSSSILSKQSQALLTNFTTASSGSSSHHFKFYGMGTFSLDWAIGMNGTAYGHVGDTYGFQSQTTYFPGLDFVLTIATNVETNSQAQPADATCLGYHAVVAAMQGTPAPKCTFTVPRHFIGTCTCTQE